MMNVNVLMSSGDTDEWTDIAETLEDAGQLVLLGHIEEEVPGAMKIVSLSQNVDQGPDLPYVTKTQTFQVVAVYAAGMWMKAEYA